MIQPTFRCNICKETWKKEETREARGCSKPVKQAVSSWDFSNTKTSLTKVWFYRCPTNFKNNQIGALINQLSRWKQNQPFYEGGLMNYPSKFVDLMDLLDNISEEYKAAESAKVSKYNGRSSKR